MVTDEKRAELEEAVTEMRMLSETIATDGWTKVLLPAFQNLREGHLNDLLNANTEKDMYKAQGVIKSIDLLLSEVDRRIAEGKEAVEELAKEKPKE